MLKYIKQIAKAIISPIIQDSSKRNRLHPGAVFKHEKLSSFSQYEEDLIIDALLTYKETGVYIDVGANDPFVLNNTLRFYRRGWRGINIEPDPRMIEQFFRLRPDDINLNVGAGNIDGELDFYQMSESTLSGFDKAAAKKSGALHGAVLKQTIKVKVTKLAEIFERHLKGTTIDFMSVDVEGFDYEVLKGNNWDKYRPSLILVEINQDRARITDLLRKVGYTEVYCNGTNSIFDGRS
jgi:FkbM family methyltransferase